MKKILFLLSLLFLAAGGVNAQNSVTITTCNEIYKQDFKAFPQTLAAMTNLNAGTQANARGWWTSSAAYRVRENGSGSAAGFRMYATTGSTDLAFGMFGNTATRRISLAVQNLTGVNVTGIKISYAGEQWRKGQNGNNQNSLTFDYRTNVVGPIVAVGGAHTAHTPLNFLAPNNNAINCSSSGAAIDGNVYRKLISSTITFATPCADQNFIFLRWTDIANLCGNHGLAIDDVTIQFITDVQPTITGPAIVCRDAASPTVDRTVSYTISQVANANTDIVITDPAGVVTNPATPVFPSNTFDILVNDATLAGIHTVTFTNSCGSVGTFKFRVPPVIVGGVAAGLPGGCGGDANVSVTGNNQQIVRWEEVSDAAGSTVISSFNTSSPTMSFTGLTPAGNHFFRAVVMDSYGCEKYSTVATVNIAASTLAIDANAVTTYCDGINEISPIINGGVAPYSVSISPDVNFEGSKTVLMAGAATTFGNLPAGTYVINVTDAGGCSKSVTVNLNGLTPNATVTGFGLATISYNGLLYDATLRWNAYSGASFYEVQRTVPAGPIEGPIYALDYTDFSINCGTGARTYNIRGVCTNGARSAWKSYTLSNIICPTRLSSDNTNVSTTLYPNPTQGTFTLSYNAGSSEVVGVKVLDMTGRSVASQSFTAKEGANNFDMNLGSVASGVYTVQVTTASGVSNMKVVKE